MTHSGLRGGILGLPFPSPHFIEEISVAKKIRPRIGSLVMIQFLDHVEDADEPIEFVVYGRLSHISCNAYTVESWAFVNPAEISNRDHNVKRFTIVKKAITELAYLDVRQIL